MPTLTGSRTRTITGHLAHLLEYPKWLIECNVDFSHCDYDGQYNAAVNECRSCDFSSGCRWLFGIRHVDTSIASLPELTDALRSAVSYVSALEAESHGKHCDCERCAWLCKAKQLLAQFHGKSRFDKTRG